MLHLSSSFTFVTTPQLKHFQAMNPKVEIKTGQSVELTCAVHAANVNKKSINWYQDGKRIVKGISRDRSDSNSF